MKLILVLLVTLSCRSTVSIERERLVVWNVGQGSWATLVGTSTCDHFDVGGDSKTLPPVLQSLCFSRSNRVFLSHTDWDHVSHLKNIYRSWKSVCLVSSPRDLHLKKARTRDFLTKVVQCEARMPKHSRGPKHGTDLDGQFGIREIKSPDNFKRGNDLSRIYELNGKWLFPGDSTVTAEREWSKNLKSRIEFLNLGHHGSRTSTSDDLLRHLPALRLAVASARYARYGHPHPEVRERLRRARIPLLVTEEWGDLIFEL